MKIRKIMSAMLAGVTIMSTTACGNADNYFTTIQKGNEIKSYTYDMSLDVKAENVAEANATVGIDLDGTILENGNFTMNITADLMASQGMMALTSNGAVNLTDVIFTGDAMYINAEKLMAALTKFGLPLELEGSAMTGVKYVKLVSDDLDLNSLEQNKEATLEDETAESVDAYALMGKAETLTDKIMVDILLGLETALKDVKPALMTKDNGADVLAINKENGAVAIDALIAFVDNDLKPIIDKAVTEAEALDADMATSLKEWRDSFETEGKAEMIKGMQSLKDNLDKFNVMDFKSSTKMSKVNGADSWNMNMDLVLAADSFASVFVEAEGTETEGESESDVLLSSTDDGTDGTEGTEDEVTEEKVTVDFVITKTAVSSDTVIEAPSDAITMEEFTTMMEGDTSDIGMLETDEFIME